MRIFTIHVVREDDNLEYIRMYRFAERNKKIVDYYLAL